MKHVIILGGGVAGLSAAHELLKRDFKVSVYEHKNIPGGKARSLDVPFSGKDGRKDLPGEHGFRFFPRFYKHLPATMKEIPVGTEGKTVYDNLVDTTRILIARFDKAGIRTSSRFPRNRADIEVMLKAIFDSDAGFEPGEIEFFAERIWQLMTSCKARRLEEYERIGWWEFIEADNKSEAYKSLLAMGLTRTLVAAQPKLASTKTGGDILLQLLFDIAKPGMSSDRVLNAPTNDAWIDPWLEYLNTTYSDKFNYQLNTEFVNFETDIKSGKITGVNIRPVHRGERACITGCGEIELKKADQYIAALPVEVMAKKISADMLKVDPTLKSIKTLAPNVSWMNGFMFYLNHDVDVDHGHTIYVDSPWALTSISQIQFWKDFQIQDYGNGKVETILSVDISDWFSDGILNFDGVKKKASECTPEEIRDDVWAQLKKSLNVEGTVLLKDEYIEDWFLDPDIVTPDEERPSKTINLEPLLVNQVNTWHLRPQAHTRIHNLYLASDYVQTNTDLATMEGANEAARRAVNSIIEREDLKLDTCEIWDLEEPFFLSFWRWLDKRRFKKGQPWDTKTPFSGGFFSKLKYKFIKLLK